MINTTDGIDYLMKKYKAEVDFADKPRPRTKFVIGPLSLALAAGSTEGVPSGKLVMIVGRESSGKTTLAMDTVAKYQRDNPGSIAGWIDFERSFDQVYAARIGIDLARVLVVRADSTERGLMICEEMITRGNIKLVIIDSVAAARPSSEDDKTYEDSPKMASNGLLLSRFCNRIIPLADNNDALVIVLNQLRMNFNSLSPEKEIPYGPKALMYTSSLTVLLRKIKTEDDRIRIEAVVRKNRLGAPALRAEYSIIYGEGIDHAGDVLDLALSCGIIAKSGAWYKFGEIKAQGMDNATRVFPIDHIRDLVLAKLTDQPIDNIEQ